MCGIFGIYNHPEASNLAYLGLYALQHRGQESAGIVSSDNRQLHHYRQMGLVSEVFTKDILKKLSGKSAIGHVRYSTTGSSELKNAQPFVVDYHKGSLAIAHNGNLTNAPLIKSELESRGSIFQSNDYWTGGGSLGIQWDGTTYGDLASWSSATGQESLKRMEFNPGFVGAGTGAAVSHPG